MPKAKTNVPPLFFSSRTLTLVVIALSRYGALTIAELADVTGLHRTRTNRALLKLKARGVVYPYRWGGRRPDTGQRWLNKPPPLWDLDRAHPFFLRIGDLGRCLASSFPPPNSPAQKRRHYKGPPRALNQSLSAEDLRLFGNGAIGRILYFLSWARNVPSRQMASTLGVSKGISESVQVLRRYDIVTVSEDGTFRRVNLNKTFCAYWSMLEIGRAIDLATGREFKALARARRVTLAMVKVRAIQKRNRIRRERRLRREERQRAPTRQTTRIPSFKKAPTRHPLLDFMGAGTGVSLAAAMRHAESLRNRTAFRQARKQTEAHQSREDSAGQMSE